jgi:hypothetical protein
MRYEYYVAHPGDPANSGYGSHGILIRTTDDAKAQLVRRNSTDPITAITISD